MSPAGVVHSLEKTTERLRDAARRDDYEDITRIVNTLSLLDARLLVGGLAVAAFEKKGTN